MTFLLIVRYSVDVLVQASSPTDRAPRTASLRFFRFSAGAMMEVGRRTQGPVMPVPLIVFGKMMVLWQKALILLVASSTLSKKTR